MNPALELTLPIDELRAGYVACDRGLWAPGGKGTNVARVLQRLGAPVHLIYATGGFVGGYISEALKSEDVRCTAINGLGETRCSVVLLPEGIEDDATILSYPGNEVCSSTFTSAFADAWASCATAGGIMCLSGSAPLGVDTNCYFDLCTSAALVGARVLIDCHGGQLTNALRAQPWLVKVNQLELEELCGSALSEQPDLRESQLRGALAWVRAQGAANVVVTLGRDGAMALWDDAFFRISLHDTPHPKNPVGAGDAFLAGIADGLAQGHDAQETLAWATAVAVASTLSMRSGSLEADPSAYVSMVAVAASDGPLADFGRRHA